MPPSPGAEDISVDGVAAKENASIPLGRPAEPGGIADAIAALVRYSNQSANLRISIDGKVRMDRLMSDGAPVCTPAGTTAYNRSVHGPVIPLAAEIIGLPPISPFRPRRWRGDLLHRTAHVGLTNLDPAKWPLGASAGSTETKDSVSVSIRAWTQRSVRVLFDHGHSLEERVIRERFMAENGWHAAHAMEGQQRFSAEDRPRPCGCQGFCPRGLRSPLSPGPALQYPCAPVQTPSRPESIGPPTMDDTLNRLIEAETRAEALAQQAEREQEQVIQSALAEAKALDQRFTARIPDMHREQIHKAEERAEQTIAELKRRYDERHVQLRDMAEQREKEALRAAFRLLLDPQR